MGNLEDILNNDSLVPLALVVVTITLLIWSLRRKQSNRPRSPERPSPVRESAPKLGQERIKRDMEDLLVELQELSRKISAEIETRFAKLEAAIQDADRRIAVLNRLNRELDENSSGSGSGSDSQQTKRSGQTGKTSKKKKPSRATRSNSKSTDSGDSKPRASSARSEDRKSEDRKSESAGTANLDSRNDVIYELADAGLTPVEIARDLGRTPGEVELILNLRRTGGK
jgi:hypothetical protein